MLTVDLLRQEEIRSVCYSTIDSFQQPLPHLTVAHCALSIISIVLKEEVLFLFLRGQSVRGQKLQSGQVQALRKSIARRILSLGRSNSFWRLSEKSETECNH